MTTLNLEDREKQMLYHLPAHTIVVDNTPSQEQPAEKPQRVIYFSQGEFKCLLSLDYYEIKTTANLNQIILIRDGDGNQLLVKVFKAGVGYIFVKRYYAET